MTSKIEFLGQLPLTERLSAKEFDAFAAICEEFNFTENAVVCYQGDEADELFVVQEGRLFSFQMDSRGIVRSSRSYLAGDVFGELGIFSSECRSTVRAGSEGRLLRIRGDNYRAYLRAFPRVATLQNFTLEDETDEESGSSSSRPDDTLLPGEKRLMNIRRSRYWLLFRLFPWLLLLFGGSWVFWRMWSGEQLGLFMALAALAMIVGLFFTGYIFLDWRNDYFVITNKHLLHYEFNLLKFQSAVSKIPMDRVQSVEILRDNPLETIFNVGAAQVTTAANAEVMLFDHIGNPTRVRETIYDLSRREEGFDTARTKRLMRRAVEDYFELPAAYTAVDADGNEVIGPQVLAVEQVGMVSRFLNNFRSRVVEGDEITYRKHWFVLIGKSWKLWLVWLLIAFVIYLSLVPKIFSNLILGVALFAFVPVTFILVWRFLDWQNDVYKVTPVFVVDIDQKPFGFGRSSKQAELVNVQFVGVVQPNVFATFFNYGNVVIEVAGRPSNIVFETIVNPRVAQRDVFRRRDEFGQADEARLEQIRRQEYAVMLDVYQQSREQDQIPRRTPEPDAIPEDAESV